MKNFTPFKLLVLAATLFLLAPATAQRATVSVSGKVTSGTQAKPEPVAYAVVALPEIGVATTTDASGNFNFPRLTPGKYKFEFSSLGMETLEVTLEVTQDRHNLSFKMKEASFFVDDVVVTAVASKAGAATSSVISRTAMDHMQPTSLADVMKLLPGQAPQSSNYMGNSASFGVRGGESLGTSVIMDGVPMSNNANMQMMTGAIGGAIPGGGGNSPLTGIDLRTIGTDGIGSIEVIQGIASAEYGDITTGAIIVNAKTGRQPLQLNFQTDQYMYGASLSHGLALGDDGRKGNLNYSLDYANNNREPREGQDQFHRVNANVRYGRNLGRLNTNTSVNFILSQDNQKPNKADEMDHQTAKRRDWEMRLTHEGTYDISAGWLKNLKYTASFSYRDRYNYFSDMLTSAGTTYSMSKTDGAVLTNRPGFEFSDATGNRITNIPAGEEDLRAWILPDTYEGVYRIYGEEYYTFLKATLNFAGRLGNTSHRIVAGGEYINEGNKGKGKVFDPETPPYRNGSYPFSSQRERAFDDIPFMNRYALYVTENMEWGAFNLSAGLRYDYLARFGGKLTPRINASYQLIKNKLNVRGGWGISAKLPTMAYLYPDNAYFDMLNFNNFDLNIPESQKLQIATTRVFDTRNRNLRMATNEKIELGFDLKVNKMNFSVTAFREKSDNNYMFAKMPGGYHSVDYYTYKGPARANLYPSDPNVMPDLELDKHYRLLLSYTSPTNYRGYDNKGIEFTLDFGRWDAIRTSLLINGLYSHTKRFTRGYYYWNDPGSYTSGNYDTYPHVGVWDAKDMEFVDSSGAYGKNHTETLRTNILITHNIPKLGFVFTVSGTVLWTQRSWKGFDEQSIAFPKYYIDRTTGQMHPFEEWMKTDPEFKGLDRTDYLTKTRDVRERRLPPVMAISINVTKEFRDRLRVSFYANNMFNSEKYHKTRVDYEYRERRAQDFSFGLKLTAIIK